MTRARGIAVIAFALYVVSVSYSVMTVLLRVQAPFWILSLNTLAFFVFALVHAGDRLGTRAMLIFLGITFVVSFIFETIGVLTGLIYGPYYYTDKLGIKLGVVPVLIPLAWFMMMYASYTLVEIIVGDTRPRGLPWSAWFALLSAMAITAWDLDGPADGRGWALGMDARRRVLRHPSTEFPRLARDDVHRLFPFSPL